jgi:hypothetical protein
MKIYPATAPDVMQKYRNSLFLSICVSISLFLPARKK